MTDQLHRLRDEIADELREIEREHNRLEDRAGAYRHVLSRIDAEIAAAGNMAPLPEPEGDRREKRDIRGAVLAVLQEYGPHSIPPIQTYVGRKIGDVTASALARSLSSLVGDGKVVEHDGVFSLPAGEPAVSKLGIGFLSGSEAAK